jgi:hypothetical protein
LIWSDFEFAENIANEVEDIFLRFQ